MGIPDTMSVEAAQLLIAWQMTEKIFAAHELPYDRDIADMINTFFSILEVIKAGHKITENQVGLLDLPPQP